MFGEGIRMISAPDAEPFPAYQTRASRGGARSIMRVSGSLVRVLSEDTCNFEFETVM